MHARRPTNSPDASRLAFVAVILIALLGMLSLLAILCPAAEPVLPSVVMVELMAPWCHVCQQIGPEVVRAKTAGWPIQQVNIDAEKSLVRAGTLEARQSGRYWYDRYGNEDTIPQFIALNVRNGELLGSVKTLPEARQLMRRYGLAPEVVK